MYFYPVQKRGSIGIQVHFHSINPHQLRDGAWDTTWRSLPNILIERPKQGQWDCLSAKSRLSVRSGQILVVPVSCRHRLLKLSSGRMYSDWIYCSCVLPDGRDLMLGEQPLRFDRDLAGRLDQCLALNELSAPSLAAELRAQSAILEIMSACLAEAGHPKQEPDDRIATVLAFMRAHLSEDLDRNVLAAQCHLSPTRFHDVFVAATGVAPMRYLTRLRLQEAQALLRHSGHSVGQIADACGFQSQAYFNRVFKRAFGVSPGAYRR